MIKTTKILGLIIMITVIFSIIVSCGQSTAYTEIAPGNTLPVTESEKSEDQKISIPVTDQNTITDTETENPKETTTVNKSSVKTTVRTTIPATPSPTPAYVPKPKNPEALSTQTENKIKQSHLVYLKNTYKNDPYVMEATLDDIMIFKYHGTYNGYVAVMVEDAFSGYTEAIELHTIDGIEIWYGSSNIIKLWKNNEFFTIDYVYEKGLITKEDVKNIAYYQNYLGDGIMRGDETE